MHLNAEDLLPSQMLLWARRHREHFSLQNTDNKKDPRDKVTPDIGLPISMHKREEPNKLCPSNASTTRNDSLQLPASSRIRPACIDEGDPLQNDERLLYGPRVAEPGEHSLNTIRKVPSDHALPQFRWGSKRRITGRSKSGLQILVPRRNVPVELVPGDPITGNSIIYAYTSSESTSGTTTHSIGAVGDHLSMAMSKPPSRKTLSGVLNSGLSRQEKPLATARSSGNFSPLASLVLGSTPDDEPYNLLVVGETGPCRRGAVPHFVAPSTLLPLRRRSFSDLMEPRSILPSPIGHPTLSSETKKEEASVEGVRPNGLEASEYEAIRSPTNIGRALKQKPPPLWIRAGPPLSSRLTETSREARTLNPLKHDLDPTLFSLPFGSTVFIMKSTNVLNLRASVTNGVWSSTKGANKVLQSAWEQKKEDERIIFMFSITHSHNYSGKYVGMAEMSGPFNPDADPQIWTPGLKGNHGIIPTRWIVVKDVQFSVFDDIKYKGQRVIQLRHANTVPGEVGRRFVQRYFESEHSTTAVIHPNDQSPITPPSSHPKKLKYSIPRNPIYTSTPCSRLEASRDYAPFHGSQPANCPIYGSAIFPQPQNPGCTRPNSMAPVLNGQAYGPFVGPRHHEMLVNQRDGLVIHTPMHGHGRPVFRF